MADTNGNNPTAAEIQTSLKGMSYPASGEDLRECAHDNNANQRVIEFLEAIPSDKQYASPAEVEKDFGQYSSDNLKQTDLDQAA